MQETLNEVETHLEQVFINNEKFFKISDVNQMRTFFMSIVSDANHWMFIGSNGGLSAGRQNAENALFPYYTDDKIVESAEITGSKTIIRINQNDSNVIWEPFSMRFSSNFNLSRNLYKNAYGNKVLFEEVNHDLGLTYQYQWNSSNAYGFVRKSKLLNHSIHAADITLLDGIQNVLPYGVGSALQSERSNLVDAYKRTELEQRSGMAIFALSAIIVDKAEPSEALKSNIAWSYGFESPIHLLSSLQLDNFRSGGHVIQENDVKAEKGAFFIVKELSLPGESSKDWAIVTDLNKSISSVLELSDSIQHNAKLPQLVDEDIDLGTQKLIALNASSDALQTTNDKLRNTRHFSNTLFNVMRGGIFDNNYQIEKVDLMAYLSQANKIVFSENKDKLIQLPSTFHLNQLIDIASESDNKSFKRLCYEYLPLKFSRRHGDPSRPWNKFSINTHDENGTKILDYEGNWRDIFQNWEALAHSYPEFIDGMIFRFLNASTFDGYNPYRITKNGIDWERIEADDPWSYIGYWGDHQIIYLLKFLEFAESHYPGKLEAYFNEDVFVYANVPYRIKSYDQLLANPKDTIDFDHDVDHKISSEWSKIGADSALLRNQSGELVQVNFVEKMLATVLAKMSNFIPEGGIWMNTQRPEWNDANNALVGNGVSMVTLYYMIRFIKFAQTLFQNVHTESITVSKELEDLYQQINDVLKSNLQLLDNTISDKERKSILDGLGKAASDYREGIYNHSFSGEKSTLTVGELESFTQVCLIYLEHSLVQNKREDGLYHAYNLMTVSGDEVSISYLSEMLEGQVAVLSSGSLTSNDALEVLNALKASALFRDDQYSYMLYPNKDLPGFGERNNINQQSVESSELLTALLADNDRQVITKDVNGGYHFNGNFKNANDLSHAIDQLQDTKYDRLIEAEKGKILQTFEDVFNHKAFTGRSGTFFGYEGLGSIYWHMVSKLLLAVQECALKAMNEPGNDEILIGKLLEHYYEIHAGIGVYKPPTLYGAFPTDPYSHTPMGKGAQQPGMTGQVKEDLLCRLGELGVVVDNGILGFNPQMLRRSEFLTDSEVFEYVNVNGQVEQIMLDSNALCFTYCQVPVVYTISNASSIEVITGDENLSIDGSSLDKKISNLVFSRCGQVKQINVNVDETVLK